MEICFLVFEFDFSKNNGANNRIAGHQTTQTDMRKCKRNKLKNIKIQSESIPRMFEKLFYTFLKNVLIRKQQERQASFILADNVTQLFAKPIS